MERDLWKKLIIIIHYVPSKTRTQYTRPAKTRRCSREHLLAWTLDRFYFRCSPLCRSKIIVPQLNRTQTNASPVNLIASISYGLNGLCRSKWTKKKRKIFALQARRKSDQKCVCTRWKTTLTVCSLCAWSLLFFSSFLYIFQMRKRNPNMSKYWCHCGQRMHVFDIWRMSGLCYRLAHDFWQWQFASTVGIRYSPNVILDMNEWEIFEIAYQRFREWKYPFSGKEWFSFSLKRFSCQLDSL